MRLLLVTSPGGHFAQLQGLRPWFCRHDFGWVAPQSVGEQVPGEALTPCAWPTTRSARAALRNTLLAWRMLSSGRYDAVVSTGAAVAVPFFAVARLLRIPTGYIECVDRVHTPSLSARLCRPLSTLFCVQWSSQTTLFPTGRTRFNTAPIVLGDLL